MAGITEQGVLRVRSQVSEELGLEYWVLQWVLQVRAGIVEDAADQ